MNFSPAFNFLVLLAAILNLVIKLCMHLKWTALFKILLKLLKFVVVQYLMCAVFPYRLLCRTYRNNFRRSRVSLIQHERITKFWHYLTNIFFSGTEWIRLLYNWYSKHHLFIITIQGERTIGKLSTQCSRKSYRCAKLLSL